MSASLNKAMIIGNVGKDPEIRHTNDGRSIANVTVASSESWNDRNSGERQERTEWHRVSVFGGLADVVEKYLKKGDSVYFEGRIQTRKWTGNDGQDRYSTEIVVDQRGGVMQMLGSRRGGGDFAGSSAPRDEAPMQSSKPARPAPPADEPFDDDIPF